MAATTSRRRRRPRDGGDDAAAAAAAAVGPTEPSGYESGLHDSMSTTAGLPTSLCTPYFYSGSWARPMPGPSVQGTCLTAGTVPYLTAGPMPGLWILHSPGVVCISAIMCLRVTGKAQAAGPDTPFQAGRKPGSSISVLLVSIFVLICSAFKHGGSVPSSSGLSSRTHTPRLITPDIEGASSILHALIGSPCT